MTKNPSVAKVFDPAKLEAMSEPLAVRVEKLKGNTRMLIPLPGGDDGSPQGANWSKEDVKNLEQWLVTEWAGGGMYSITVTDGTVPQAQKHDWQIFYNPQEFPEKVPPTLQAAAAERPHAQPQQPSQVRSMFPSAFTTGLPAGAQAQQAAPGQPTTVYVPYQQPAPYQAQPIARVDTSAVAAADAERRRLEDQLKEMQAQLARAREEQMHTQHRQELERAEARMRTEQSAIKDQFEGLKQAIAQLATANARPAVDPAMEALKEQNRLMMQQVEEAKREREAERRERELRDSIAAQKEDTRRQIEAMNAQLAATLAAAQANKAPDPMIMFLQENARQQIEAAKEASRNQTAQFAQLQALMMNPRDIMAMTKESSNGLEATTRQITSAYQAILEMQRNAVEQIMQLNGSGGNETMQLIEKGIDRASSFAERFIGGKTKEAVTTQQTQAQLAQANAAAMTAQANAMHAQAAMQANAARQADSGLNGARPPIQPTPVPAKAGPSGETQVSQTSSVPIANANANEQWTTGPVPPVVVGPPVKRVLGHTDEEWFGPILPKVTELREGVARFIESIAKTPPRLNKDGSVDGMEPEQAADVILQAAMIIMQQQVPVAAMIQLLGQGRVADFMDVLLPDAPQPYRDAVAQLVLTELQGGGDDDDEDEEDESEEEAPVANAQPIPPTPVPPRARA